MAPMRCGTRRHPRAPSVETPAVETFVFGVLIGLVIALTLVLFKPQLPSQVAASASAFSRAASAALADGKHLQPVAAAGGSVWYRRPEAPADLPVEVYALGPSTDVDAVSRVSALLTDGEKKQLRELCVVTLHNNLQTDWVSHKSGIWSFVPTDAQAASTGATGDLPPTWIRDSAVQIGVLLPRIAKRPALRRVVEGTIRAQAFIIAGCKPSTSQGYSNVYESNWRCPGDRRNGDRVLGCGSCVGVRNYELNSGAYYLNLLWNWYLTPGLYRPELLLDDPLIFGAANLLVDAWIREQRQNASCPCRHTKLSINGLGPEVDFTGMTWSSFRPSDDPSTYGFSIPANMYAAAGLERALEINRQIWRDQEFNTKASQLLQGIRSGIDKHGKVQLDGTTVYAYEVDGKGCSVTDFDDPNIPSLVSVPMLGYKWYDKGAYEATRKRLLSSATNRYYFEGSQFQGMGSPHTSDRMALALGIYTEMLTATDPKEQARGLRAVLKLQCGDGLMHESVNVDNLQPRTCSGEGSAPQGVSSLQWANALLVVAVERLLGYDCDAVFQLG